MINKIKVLITGSNGFIGKNLLLRLAERPDVQVICFTRINLLSQLQDMVRGVDYVFHLAGVSRSLDPADFVTGNTDLTKMLCKEITNVAETTGRKVHVVYTSSTQAACENDYGKSKRSAEDALLELKHSSGVPVHVFRLPNVFGKWCKPNYNSVVATFCHNIARDLPIQVNDPVAPITLLYIDDLVESFVQLMDGADTAVDADSFSTITPQYTTTVGELARQFQIFKESRTTLMTQRVGTGLLRALYSTYVSYLPVESFAYTVPLHADPRGMFVEMLKTPDCGQISYFTARPGITRGGHYHHSKTEKFLVIKGQARFKFRHMHTGQSYELVNTGDKPQVVESVPGWTHDITNIGSEEMFVVLWANEVFDRTHPDTLSCPL
jgi:UDP-2-acetamido-2,6-beta-L-arabino-hexul-4-ose reductase